MKCLILARNFADSEFPIWIYDVAIFLYYFKIVKLFVYKLHFIYISMNKIIITQSCISAKDQCKHRVFFYLLLIQFCFYEFICASYDARKLMRYVLRLRRVLTLPIPSFKLILRYWKTVNSHASNCAFLAIQLEATISFISITNTNLRVNPFFKMLVLQFIFLFVTSTKFSSLIPHFQ